MKTVINTLFPITGFRRATYYKTLHIVTPASTTRSMGKGMKDLFKMRIMTKYRLPLYFQLGHSFVIAEHLRKSLTQ